MKNKKQELCFYLVLMIILNSILFSSESKADSITGTVIDESGPVVDLYVDVYTPERQWLFGRKTDSNGLYVLPNLAPGSYKLNYFTTGTQYITEWYKDQYFFQEADPVEVVGDITLDTVKLEKSSVSISGFVKNTDNIAIQNVSVQVYDKNGDWVTTKKTDANGWYSIAGLGMGEYRLRFLASSTGYVTEWHEDKPAKDSASIITLNGSISIDVVLDLGGSISGKITDSSTGEAIKSARIDVYDKNLDANGRPVWRGSAVSAADGSYLVKGLPSGEHKIEVFKAYNTEPKEWYKNRSSFSSATPVPVNAEEETGGIDIALGPEPPTDLSQVYKLLLLKKRCTIVNGVRVCR